jgi:hypothetical protein
MHRYGIRIFGKEITKLMVIYGVYIRFWPTLPITTVQAGENEELKLEEKCLPK